MNEFDIARLISRQRLDIQTPAEEKQLQEWLAASEENRKLFEQISTGNSFTKRKVLEEQTDINKEYKIMVQKMKRSRIRRWILGTASAAAILACGVMAAIFWIPDKSSQPQTVAMSSDNIELIFPNGKRFCWATSNPPTTRFQRVSNSSKMSPIKINWLTLTMILQARLQPLLSR